MALAGLWENLRCPTGEWVRSFAIVTTTPNELCAELHNRMPVVLGHDAWPTWLGEEPGDPDELKSLSRRTHQSHDLLAGKRARRQNQKQ
jgi:putative SOS response-associated peptidase YedK